MQPGCAIPALGAVPTAGSTMERRAELDRFAIFLLCLLVPLGSLAPTGSVNKSKAAPGQNHKDFTPSDTSAAVIVEYATDLFKHYNKCISATPQTESWRTNSKAKAMVQTIPQCWVLHANCCVLHHFYNTLTSLKSDMETLCFHNSSDDLIDATLIQLQVMLSQSAEFYSCSPAAQPRPSPAPGTASSTYIWWVLKRFEEILTGRKKWPSPQ